MGRSQIRLFLHRGLPVGDSRVILLPVIEELTQVIVGLRGGGQDRNGVFQDRKFLRLVGEAEIRRQAFRLQSLRGSGFRVVHTAFRICEGIILQRGFSRAGGKHCRGVFPAAETHELIGSIQGFLRTASGCPVKGRLSGAPVQQGQIQRINGQAFLQETPVFRRISAELPKGGGFQAAGFHIVPAADQAFIRKVQRFCNPSFPETETAQVKIGGACGFSTPDSFVEGIEGFLRPAQHFQGEAQVIVCFPGVGIGVPPGLFSDGGFKIRNAFTDPGVPQQVQAVGIVQPDIGGITAQAFQVIIRWQEGGMTVLLQMLSCQEQLLQGLDFFRLFQRFGRFGYGPVFLHIFPVFTQFFSIRVGNRHLVVLQVFHCFNNGFERRQICFPSTDFPSGGTDHDFGIREGAGCIYFDTGGGSFPAKGVICFLAIRKGIRIQDFSVRVNIVNAQHHIPGCIADPAYGFVGHEILGEILFLMRLQPGKVRLVVTVYAGHQLNIGTVFIRQVPVPGFAEVAAAPGPLLFPGTDMVIGYVKQAGIPAFIKVADKVKIRMSGHIGRGNPDVFIA